MIAVVAATLLRYVSEEDAYWILICLIDDILPKDFYTATMDGLRVEIKLLRFFMGIKCPKILNHLTELGLDLNAFAPRWFLCLFSAEFEEKEVPKKKKKSGVHPIFIFFEKKKSIVRVRGYSS